MLFKERQFGALFVCATSLLLAAIVSIKAQCLTLQMPIGLLKTCPAR
jgi:hypothetical protein